MTRGDVFIPVKEDTKNYAKKYLFKETRFSLFLLQLLLMRVCMTSVCRHCIFINHFLFVGISLNALHVKSKMFLEICLKFEISCLQ